MCIVFFIFHSVLTQMWESCKINLDLCNNFYLNGFQLCKRIIYLK